MVGDSGLGKSPLLYQFGVCVASGSPFLDLPVDRPRKVLYVDCENSQMSQLEIVRAVSTHLGLLEPPNNLLLWNANDPDSEHEGRSPDDIIRQSGADLVLLDPLVTLYSGFSEKYADVDAGYAHLRAMSAETGCSIIGLHHPRKMPHKVR
jgi:RecA-family ATPase